jgi:2-oxo-4-hydroxy-4-carboxy-5-ureidoimidazoline decarboxylase
VIDLQDAESRDRLAAALHVRRWVDEISAGGPYPSVDALVAAGERAAEGLSDAEIDEAIAADVVPSPGTDREGLRRADEGPDAAVARGDQVYEERFGRAFVIRTAGRSRQEVLDELQRRLKNDPDQETQETKEQLREIAALRLRTLFAEPGP